MHKHHSEALYTPGVLVYQRRAVNKQLKSLRDIASEHRERITRFVVSRGYCASVGSKVTCTCLSGCFKYVCIFTCS